MSDLIGVKSILDVAGDAINQSSSNPILLKREALMFSRIAIPYLSQAESLFEKLNFHHTNLIDELGWLSEQGIIFEPEEYTTEALLQDGEFKWLYDSERKLSEMAEGFGSVFFGWQSKMKVTVQTPPGASRADIVQAVLMPIIVSNRFAARRISIQLRDSNIEAYPILPTLERVFQNTSSNKYAVVKIVLNSLPVPDDSTPWEQIIDYRNDPNSQDRFWELRRWMSKVSRSDLSLSEIEEELECSMRAYRKHMELHKMKTRPGTLTAFVIATARFIENIMKRNFEKTAEHLLIEQSSIALSQVEMSAPGKEVAYIVNARESFG